MPIRTPVTAGQLAFAVLPSAGGHRVQMVAVQEAYHGGEAVRAFDADEAGDIYLDPMRVLAAEMVYDEPAAAEAVAASFNLLGSSTTVPNLLAARVRAWAADRGQTPAAVAYRFGLTPAQFDGLRLSAVPDTGAAAEALADLFAPPSRREQVVDWLLELGFPFPDED